MDKFTATGKIMALARVLLEVNVDSKLPDIKTIGCRGTSFQQALQYIGSQ